LTGRVGIAANNWLFYFKGGGAWANLDRSTQAVNPATGVVLTNASGSADLSGWTVGGGFEWGFAPQWSAKVEYNYIDFGTTTTNQNVTFSTAAVPNPLVRDVDLSLHVIKGGINYRFGAM
jgi:outer membrane immunogenic protein